MRRFLITLAAVLITVSVNAQKKWTLKKQQKVAVAISEASKKYNVSEETFFKDAVAMLNLALEKKIIKKGV